MNNTNKSTLTPNDIVKLINQSNQLAQCIADLLDAKLEDEAMCLAKVQYEAYKIYFTSIQLGSKK